MGVSVRVRGIPDRDPPDIPQRTPWTETPWTETPPLGQRPLRQRNPLGETLPLDRDRDARLVM